VYSYRAPLRDIRFVVHEVLDLEQHYRSFGREELNKDLLEGILEEGARFAETVLAPPTGSATSMACASRTAWSTRRPASRRPTIAIARTAGSPCAPTPSGAARACREGFALAFSEMLISGNMAWKMYSGLTESAALTIQAHGTEEQKRRYLPRMVSGEWAGTMCLTEAHSGSDLGILRTKAEPLPTDPTRSPAPRCSSPPASTTSLTT